jgi:CrtC N-terminal lipocalin domain/Lipocalin-like domain
MDLNETLLPVAIELPEQQGTVLEEGSGIGAELWWISGRLDGGGRRFWVHWIAVNAVEPAPGVLGWTSIRAEDGDTHAHETFQHGVEETSIARGELGVKVPSSSLTGTLEEMSFEAKAPGGSMSLTMRPSTPILYGAGAGFYPLYDGITYQYSVTAIPTTGTIELDGETVEVEGTTWYDRQWFQGQLPGGPLTWFGLCLDNGESVSIFDVPPNGTSWATAIHADGSHTHSPIAPLARSASGEVRVAETGNFHPRSWTIEIPILGARLDLTQSPMHENEHLYTGSVAVEGTYRGKPVSGFGFIDIPPVYDEQPAV